MSLVFSSSEINKWIVAADRLYSAIEEIKTSVAALSKQSFGKRIVHHEALSMRIRRAYNEMNTVIHAFNVREVLIVYPTETEGITAWRNR